MSHFTVTVCLADPYGRLAKASGDDLRSAVTERLGDALAPWDENREVPPYRDYEEGGPEDYWLYRSLRRAEEDDRNGTGVKPYDPDGPSISSSSSRKTRAEQRVEIAREAALFRSLPEPVTWEALLDVYRLLYPESADDVPLLDEEGRAYTVSRYNPQSKWDCWRIGGRWAGYFAFRPERAGEVVMPEKGRDSPQEVKPGRCDAGPKGALDFAETRDQAAEEARGTYREYHALVDSLPEAEPWKAFLARTEGEAPYTIGHAREDYHSQPRVRAVERTDFAWRDDPVSEFSVSEDLYAERARAAAVPGFATVTLDGRWMAPGRMGWWAATDATEDTRIGYQEAANAYLDSLPDDAWVAVVDCHI